MFKLNDIISAVPESSSKSVAVPARVCYIHPMGRFMSWNFISERAAVLYTGRAASSLRRSTKKASQKAFLILVPR